MSKILKAKKKLIEEYKSTNASLSLDNSKLEKKIKDMETTLNLNQNILYNYILNSPSINKTLEEKQNLINTTKKLWEENLTLLKKKSTVNMKLSFLQEISEDTPNKIREEIRYYKTNNDKIKEIINKQKEEIIKKQKKLIDIRKNNFHTEAKTENYVTAPNKKNVEWNQEVITINLMLKKILEIHQNKEKEATSLKEEIDSLINQVNNLKENAYEINNEKNVLSNKKNINEFISKNIKEYNISADENEKEDALNEDKKDDEDIDESLSNNEVKKLQSELNKLTEEYKSLKKQCEEYDEKIAKYKMDFRNVEGKINNIKISFGI